MSAWRIAWRAGWHLTVCSLAKRGWKAFSMHWLCFPGGLPLLYQACCLALLEVKMKNNDNSPHSLDINSIPGSGLASYSIWSSPQPCEVSAYLIPVLGMGIMRHREDKELAKVAQLERQSQALNSRACVLSRKAFLVAAWRLEVPPSSNV